MIRSLIALGFALALAGCAAGPRTAPGPASSREGAFVNRPREAPIFRADGRAASWSELVTQSSGAEAVMLGENHGHPSGLAVAAALWEDIVADHPPASESVAAGPALALEFWERDEQIILDDYLTGVTNDAAFLAASRKAIGKGQEADSPGFPAGHRAMVRTAKEHRRPVVAANAPRRYVRLARTIGFDPLRQLNERQQALFRIPDTLFEGRYRDDFEKVMGGKPIAEAPRAHDDMFRSQSVWDWTMSESVARLVNAGNTPAVLVVGRFHTDHAGGLVQALQAQRPGTRTITVSFVEENAPATLSNEDRGRADFIVFVGNR